MYSKKRPPDREDEHAPPTEEPAAPAQESAYDRMRVLASQVGNQVFRQVVARDPAGRPGFGSGSAPPAPDPVRPPTARAGFGNKPHAVDPAAHTDEPHEPALPESPYGKLPYPAPAGAPDRTSLNLFTRNSLRSDAAVRAEHAEFKREMAGGESGASGFLAKNEKGLGGEIDANQSKDAKEAGGDLEQQREIVRLTDTVIAHITTDLDDARSSLASANLKLQSLGDLADARRLAAKAKEVEEEAGEVLEHLKTAVDLARTVVTFDPVGAAKALYDALGKAAVVKLSAAERLKSESDDKRRSGDNAALQAAWVDIDAATKKINDLGTLAAKTEPDAEASVKNFQRMRMEAEGAFDASTGGHFKFGALRGHLAWATAAGPRAELLTHRFEDALADSGHLKDTYEQTIDEMLKHDGDPGVYRAALKPVTAMITAQRQGLADTRSSGARVQALLARLTDLRDKGDRRLAEAPVPGRRSGSKSRTP